MVGGGLEGAALRRRFPTTLRTHFWELHKYGPPLISGRIIGGSRWRPPGSHRRGQSLLPRPGQGGFDAAERQRAPPGSQWHEANKSTLDSSRIREASANKQEPAQRSKSPQRGVIIAPSTSPYEQQPRSLGLARFRRLCAWLIAKTPSSRKIKCCLAVCGAGPKARRSGAATNTSCEAAGLGPVQLRGLRHAAKSLIARSADPVFARPPSKRSVPPKRAVGPGGVLPDRCLRQPKTDPGFFSSQVRPEKRDRLDRLDRAAGMNASTCAVPIVVLRRETKGIGGEKPPAGPPLRRSDRRSN